MSVTPAACLLRSASWRIPGPATLRVVCALSVPFWLAGSVLDAEIVDGLPVSAGMAVCPLVAAVIVVDREHGSGAARQLLARAWDYGKIRPLAWYIPILALKPAVMLLAYVAIRLAGISVPAPAFPVPAFAMGSLFFVAAIGEEVGWSGYAIDRLLQRFTAIPAALVLGVIWAAWHIVPLLQADRAWNWIGWHSLGTVASRVLIVWVYVRKGGCVSAAVLYHTADNLSWLLFPRLGLHYPPHISGPLTAAVAAIVVLLAPPRTPQRAGARIDPGV